jgi:hypothetical protein
MKRSLHVMCDCFIAMSIWLNVVYLAPSHELFWCNLARWVEINLLDDFGREDYDRSAFWTTSCYSL